MYVRWKSLISVGIAFWGLLCCTDLLGESTWKRCTQNFNDLIKIHPKLQKPENHVQTTMEKMSAPNLFWNICAFLCSLIFCSIMKTVSWFAMRAFKAYAVLKNRPKTDESQETEVIFQNQELVPKIDESSKLSEELEEIKKEKSELAEQLVMAQKENLNARQQIEEYKLETFMVKEKLQRTTNSLKENLKFKDFASANQELITRKAHNLELHLKDVSRDRDLLKSKLGAMEKNFLKVQEKLRQMEQEGQLPEKDTSYSPPSEITDSELNNKFQKKILELQQRNGFEAKLNEFKTNSKISVDLDESSMDVSNKENEDDVKKTEIQAVQQNILTYNAYKTQMLRPKMKLCNNIKEHLYSPPDTTGSSSDENSGPHRIISSTVEFQTFLKNLASNSSSSGNFHASHLF